MKNVIAIASGMADGVGAGDNTRAAVMTRGLGGDDPARRRDGRRADDVRRAGGHGRPAGDVHQPAVRNRYVGEQLGKGRTIDEIIAEMNQVAEGVKSCRTVLELAESVGVEMPITTEVVGVVHGGRTANDAYRGLIGRTPARHEHQPG